MTIVRVKATTPFVGFVTLFCSLIVLLAFASLAGCKPETETKLEKKPRPVEVKVLAKSNLDSNAFVTAPVGSWKTERIGFEVTGRIEFVVEPNTDINPKIVDNDSSDDNLKDSLNKALAQSKGTGFEIKNLIPPPTPIARINKERYELQVKSQQAQVSRAEQAIEAAIIQIEKTIPAQLRAAKAELKRADKEYQRSMRLYEQNAGARSDVDRDEAAFNTAQSQIEQLNASLKAQQAERLSLDAQLLQAKDSLRDAERNRDNCTLYSSFKGQIASVDVVPGSVVAAGTPVATIQMMDPIKVEVEVSAEDSRRLRNRQRIPVLVTREDGQVEEKDGYLYLVDPVADTQTRTFTLTLLVINERLTDSNESGIPTTDQTWRVDFEFLPGAQEGLFYVSEDAIFNDEQGPFVWQVTNMELHGTMPKDRILDVRKARVRLGPVKIPFLGNWTFQQIEFDDPEFDPKKNLITGKLKIDGEQTTDWEGSKVLFQNEGQWMLRPGDLVKVNLADNVETSGLFVPMDAIGYEMEKTFLFLLSEDSLTVEQVEVNVIVSEAGTSSIVAVEPTDTSLTLEGRKYVSRGAHYLVDGEKVRPVESESVQ